jgi:hypothetical protein
MSDSSSDSSGDDEPQKVKALKRIAYEKALKRIAYETAWEFCTLLGEDLCKERFRDAVGESGTIDDFIKTQTAPPKKIPVKQNTTPATQFATPPASPAGSDLSVSPNGTPQTTPGPARGKYVDMQIMY